MLTNILIVLLLISGCVPISQYKRDIKAAVSKCEQEMASKNERLKKFNQINPDGSLRGEHAD